MKGVGEGWFCIDELYISAFGCVDDLSLRAGWLTPGRPVLTLEALLTIVRSAELYIISMEDMCKDRS
jgi:hypothetical protein